MQKSTERTGFQRTVTGVDFPEPTRRTRWIPTTLLLAIGLCAIVLVGFDGTRRRIWSSCTGNAVGSKQAPGRGVRRQAHPFQPRSAQRVAWSDPRLHG